MSCRVKKAPGAKEFGLDPEDSGERDQMRSCGKPCWLLCRVEVGVGRMPDERRDRWGKGPVWLLEGIGGGSDQVDD